MRTSCLAGLSVLALLQGSAALAGSATAGSLMSKTNAIANATASMPAGNTVTDVRCLTIIKDQSARYRCTVYWSPAAQQGDG